MFLFGRVATSDGAPVPNNVLVERLCDGSVRQQVYAQSRGDFSMELGTRANSFVDASGEGPTQFSQTAKNPETGISRRDLANCELRASVSGFESSVINLVNLTDFGKNVNVGSIVVQRRAKVKGMTVSATPYKAPKDARRAYEKGLQAERDGQYVDARQYLEKAVEIYPKYTNAWFQLGDVLQNLAEKESARRAYVQATMIDSRFLPPYVSLASMAYNAEDWKQVVSLTNHVLDSDPMKDSKSTSYILDLDPLDYTAAYFYNAAANYQLNRMQEAEKSGLKAERLDVRPRFPQVHLLLAEIFARKNDYATAISQTKIYLELAPQGKDAKQAREQLAELEKLNGGNRKNQR